MFPFFSLRKICSAAAALCLLTTVTAQTPEEIDQTGTRNIHRNFILRALQEQSKAAIAEKPTGIKQRVIAQTDRSTNGWDSTTYVYSGNKGSRFNYNWYTYNGAVNMGWFPFDFSPRMIKPTDVLADTVRKFEDGSLYYKDYGTYRADNQLSFVKSEYYFSAPYERSESEIKYNSSGQPVVHYISNYNVSDPADTSTILKFTYDSGGKLSLDSTWIKDNGTWTLDNTSRYYYDASGAILRDSLFSMASPIALASRVTTYSYYPDGKIEVIKSTFYASEDEATHVIQDSIGYTSNIGYCTYWENKYISLFTGTSNSRIDIRYPNPSSGLPDSAKRISISTSGQTERALRYEYNSHGNPETITTRNAADLSEILSTTRFYYETYDDGVSIEEVSRAADVSVYPNPFNSYIDIECKEARSSAYTIELLDLTGRQLLKSVIQNKKTSRIVVPHLSPGAYILMLRDSQGRSFYRKLIKS